MASDALAASGTSFAPEHVTDTTGFWFTEDVTPDLRMQMRLSGIHFEARSEFQRVQVIETVWGKTLVLDGKSQSAKFDEFIYHECLVHPAMLLHGSAKRVFVGGGGELATTREVLRHSGVERCVMVDLDEVVVDICKEKLPEWGAGCTEDPRLEVVCTDAYKWLKEHDETFDVIIMDIADPIEAGPGYVLYTKEFYEFALTKLNPGGVIVTQSGPGDVHNHGECFTTIHSTLRSAFECVCGYTASVPSFGSNWAFNVAWKARGREGARLAAGADTVSEAALRHRTAEETDRLIDANIKGGSDALRFLDGVAHHGIFGLPKPIRQALERETTVATVDNPPSMY